jgi:hypothetical protein
MTKQDAHDFLNELWQNGEIPQNFDENHSDYESAVKYTMENNQFDYEKFNDNKVIIKFGDWQVERDALVGKVGYDYIIADTSLWESSEYKGILVWDWLIHLTEKPWIDKDSVKDLNMAFFFCQDYFKKLKPKDLPYISTAQTLYFQKQIIEIDEEFSKLEKVDKHGIVIPNSENFNAFVKRKSEIKSL